uniref:Zgc:92518 n=1 Tax=Cyprinus carpio TaxID=7962 RepID=A0A8C1R706_CYPCA
MVLCHFLDTHREEYNLMDKNIIELGAGTGLGTIVTSVLGAKVTSTDLPDVLSNLRHNVNRNTRGRCRHEPCVTELSWGNSWRKDSRAQPVSGVRGSLPPQAHGDLHALELRRHHHSVGNAVPSGSREQLRGHILETLSSGGTL